VGIIIPRTRPLYVVQLIVPLGFSVLLISSRELKTDTLVGRFCIYNVFFNIPWYFDDTDCSRYGPEKQKDTTKL
jgi:hypothetical protein